MCNFTFRTCLLSCSILVPFLSNYPAIRSTSPFLSADIIYWTFSDIRSRSTLKSLGLWKSAEECHKDNQATNLLNLNYVEPHRSSLASGSASEEVTEVTTVNLALPQQGPSEELAGQSTDSYQNQTVPQMKVNSRSISASDENVSKWVFACPAW